MRRLARRLPPARALFAPVLFVLAFSPALAQETFDFMPKGGKALLLDILGDPPDGQALRDIAKAKRDTEEWRETLAPRTQRLTEKQVDTLANYLAVNMPLADAALAKAGSQADWAGALPPDGRELAWNNCQFCHALFSGYLTHRRGVQGWRGTFETPFHREIRMTEQERETFARYSAINMPMKVEDVPAELRF